MASRFKVTVARRCEPRVKALRGEVKKRFDGVVEELRHRGCEAGGIRMRADTGQDHRVCERASTETGVCISSLGTKTTSSSPGWAGTPRTRTFIHKAREASQALAASVVLATSSRSAVTALKIHQPTQTWFISSIRSVPHADSVEPMSRRRYSGVSSPNLARQQPASPLAIVGVRPRRSPERAPSVGPRGARCRHWMQPGRHSWQQALERAQAVRSIQAAVLRSAAGL